MDDFTLTQLADLAGQIALSVTLLYLLIAERKAHDETRRQYRADLLKLTEDLQDLLKEVAGIRANMWNVQRYAHAEKDTRPLPEVD